MTPMEKIVQYLDERGAILAARLAKPDCINRSETEARLAEVQGIINRLAVLVELDKLRRPA